MPWNATFTSSSYGSACAWLSITQPSSFNGPPWYIRGRTPLWKHSGQSLINQATGLGLPGVTPSFCPSKQPPNKPAFQHNAHRRTLRGSQPRDTIKTVINLKLDNMFSWITGPRITNAIEDLQPGTRRQAA